jgi:hypothetical protein
MPRPARLVTVVPILMSLLAAPLHSQVIRGTVIDDSTSLPIAGAEVILRDSLEKTVWLEVTDFDGRFSMSPAPGIYTFEVLRMGYERVYTEAFEVAMDVGDIDLTITLPNAPVMLEPAVVSGEKQPLPAVRLEGFYRRKERGWGIQLDREAIEAKTPTQVTDILLNLPGVRVIGTGGNTYTVVMVGQAPRLPQRSAQPPSRGTRNPIPPAAQLAGGGGCPISYWVDGIRFISNPEDNRGINEILASKVEAVEVYRRASETPAEFLDSDSRCGVVVTWTKRGR